MDVHSNANLGSALDLAEFDVSISKVELCVLQNPQMFFLDPSVHCAPNDEVVVDFEMRRKEKNHRLMHVRMVHHVEGRSAMPAAGAAHKRTSVFSIE